MDRKEFRQLLKRYLKGTCTDEERAWIDRWYELLYDRSLPPLADAEFDRLEGEIWAGIQQQGQIVPKVEAPVRRLRSWHYGAAAAAVLVVLFTANYLIYPVLAPPLTAYEKLRTVPGLQETVNSSGSVKELQLEDGSTVRLQPGSRLAFPARFKADRREVYLEGEAFFNVARNARRPFFVYNGRLVTQVLGTSFDMKVDRASGEVTVAVATGKVAVYELREGAARRKKNNGVIVTPNQKVVYDIDSRLFETALVDEPQPLASPRRDPVAAPRFSFEDEKLSVVLEAMEKVYGIEIIAESESLYDCSFTGDITRQPLYTKLEIICQSIDASYEIKGTRILVKGKGCSPL